MDGRRHPVMASKCQSRSVSNHSIRKERPPGKLRVLRKAVAPRTGRLREEPAFARARVAVLSASAMPGDVAAAREAGVVEYWVKPLDVPRFLKDVQRLLKP
jgi:hypothetical protein